MAIRLAQLVEYKTGGSRVEFCALMGWTKQYLNKLLNGQNIGLSVVLAIVETFPDVNARWLLTGVGSMIELNLGRVFRMWVELEQYIPVMSTDEQRKLRDGVLSYTAQDLARWTLALDTRDAAIRTRFAEAYAKQNPQITCK